MNELLPAMTNERIIELAYSGAMHLYDVALELYTNAHKQSDLQYLNELCDEITQLGKLMDEYNH